MAIYALPQACARPNFALASRSSTIQKRGPNRVIAALVVCAALLAGPLLAALPATADAPTPLYTSQPSPTPVYANVTAAAGVWGNRSIYNVTDLQRELSRGLLNGGRGACVADFDNDGLDDIYVVGPGENQMFRNLGNFSFSDVSAAAGVAHRAYGMGCTSGDLDNDGDQDILATNWHAGVTLYRNNGGLTFTDVTSSCQITDKSAQTGAALADFDNDGLLDVFLPLYQRTSDRIYRNLGNLTFEDKTSGSDILDQAYGFQALALDWNHDRLMDVYVVNDFGVDAFWQNLGNWRFTNVAGAVGADDRRGGMGGAWGDYDRDGLLDLFVTNYEGDGLYHANGANYTDLGNQSGVDDPWVGWGTVWTDYDNDGWDDLYLVNGAVENTRAYNQPNKLFHNLGDGTFADASEGSGAWGADVGRGLAAGDFDRDGREDLYVLNVDSPNTLYRNVLNTSNNWLDVRLQGVVSNRDGVGAEVQVVTGSATQTKLMTAGSSYLSTNTKTLHFGLGATTLVDQIIVNWPSGLVQTQSWVASNNTVTIIEDDFEPPVAVAPDVVIDQGDPFTLNANGSTDNVEIADYRWQVDVNGTPASATGPLATMAIYTPGVFSGTLEVEDVFGLRANTTFAVTVNPLARVTLDAGPDRLVGQGFAVNFSASAVSSATPDCLAMCSFAWTFDYNGSTEVLWGPQPGFLFDRKGLYNITAFVVDPQNATDSDVVVVTVVDSVAPTVVAVVPGVFNEDQQILLDATTSTDDDPGFPGNGQFTWSYVGRNGLVSWTGVNVGASFPDPGNYALTLDVEDSSGNLVSVSFAIRVRDITVPTPNAGPDRTVDPGEPVSLTAAASTDNDLAFLTQGDFIWTVHGPQGDLLFFNNTAQVSFATPGAFVVELDVWDPTGNHAEAPDLMVIRVRDLSPPVVVLSGSLRAHVGVAYSFNASGTSDDDPAFGQTGNFTWEFESSAGRVTLFGAQPSHTFAEPGPYSLRLRVADSSGNANTKMLEITAVDEVLPVLTVAPIDTNLTAGSVLQLSAAGTSDNVRLSSVTWRVTGPDSFDQSIAGLQGALVFGLEGTYNATVTATDSSGNMASQTFEITVTRMPGPGGPPGVDEDPIVWVWRGAIASVLVAAYLVGYQLYRKRLAPPPKQE